MEANVMESRSTPLLYAALFLVVLSACEDKNAVSENYTYAPHTFEPDRQLLRVTEFIPTFGGMYFDDKGDLIVHIATEQPLGARESKAMRHQLETLLPAIFDRACLQQWKVTQGKVKQAREPQIVIRKADYGFAQLVSWRKVADRALQIQGVLGTDIDEVANRLWLGIETEELRPRIEAFLKTHDIPQAPVVIEVVPQVRLLKDVRDKFRPVSGGIQTDSGGDCTMGFNAIWNGKKGFVTNSHCTKQLGGLGYKKGSVFHQPDDPGWWPFWENRWRNKIGDEVYDPEYNLYCGDGITLCRKSDSAFVEYDSTDYFSGAKIAKVTELGSLDLNEQSPYYDIVGENLCPLAGTHVCKVGRTTGLTCGRISHTCVTRDHRLARMVCQYQVTSSWNSGGITLLADGGDSGSPVFQPLGGNDVNLTGQLWGGYDKDSTKFAGDFVFSSLLFVQDELSPLITSDFPTANETPQICPAGQRCCEQAANGDCLICWPTQSECP
jgi:hypothetical protein